MPETDAGDADFAEFVDGSLPALLRFGYVLTGSTATNTAGKPIHAPANTGPQAIAITP